MTTLWNEAQSSSGFVTSPPGAPAGSARPTYAEINLDAIAHNLSCVRRVAGGSQVFAVIKADAYGHGLVPVARRLAQERVDGICVALAEEGLRLRDARIESPILVLNGAYGQSHGEVLRAGLTPVIYDLAQAQAFSTAGQSSMVEVHLKIDTGMSRLGVPYDRLAEVLRSLSELHNIRIVGVMTHLAAADSDAEFTALQCKRFEASIAEVYAAGHQPRMRHIANSAGTYAHVSDRYEMVRVGLALYGVSPVANAGADLRPAMRVRSEVLSIRELPEGTPIGYNCSYRTTRPSRIAVVPIGYGDGFLRASGGRGHMLVRGERCPIVGRISMDLTTLDVTDLKVVQIGDEAVVLGRQGQQELSAAEVAQAAGTIAYEVLCNLSARVPRLYR